MNLLYRFETSSKVQSIELDQLTCEISFVVDRILNKLFKGKEPSCNLELIDKTTEVLRCNNSNPYVFRRAYLNKFKRASIPIVKVNSLSPVKKKRRWRSRSPKKRRWRSRSPKIKIQRNR